MLFGVLTLITRGITCSWVESYLPLHSKAHMTCRNQDAVGSSVLRNPAHYRARLHILCKCQWNWGKKMSRKKLLPLSAVSWQIQALLCPRNSRGARGGCRKQTSLCPPSLWCATWQKEDSPCREGLSLQSL